MTQTTDSAAIVTANELLADAETPVEALRDAQQGIRDELRRHEQHPRHEIGQATSMEQRKAWQQENADRSAEGEVLSNLYRRLGDAIQRRRAQDAMEGAEGDRTALEKALQQAEEARAQYLAAGQTALDIADRIAQGRQAAGYPGRDKVGATPEQIDLLQDLAEPLLEGVALKRLRLTTQLGDPAKAA